MNLREIREKIKELDAEMEKQAKLRDEAEVGSREFFEAVEQIERLSADICKAQCRLEREHERIPTDAELEQMERATRGMYEHGYDDDF